MGAVGCKRAPIGSPIGGAPALAPNRNTQRRSSPAEPTPPPDAGCARPEGCHAAGGGACKRGEAPPLRGASLPRMRAPAQLPFAARASRQVPTSARSLRRCAGRRRWQPALFHRLARGNPTSHSEARRSGRRPEPSAPRLPAPARALAPPPPAAAARAGGSRIGGLAPARCALASGAGSRWRRWSWVLAGWRATSALGRPAGRGGAGCSAGSARLFS